MTDPSKNSFQNSMSLYMGGTDGTKLGPGMTGADQLQSTKAQAFVVGWQGPESPLSVQSGTSCGIEMKAFPSQNASLIDFHSTSGYLTNTYDFRLQSTGGATGTAGQAKMIALGGDLDIRCPINVGLGAPQFKLDYGRQAVTGGVNADTTITFTAGLFTAAPKVTLSFFDSDGPTSNPGGDVVPYVYNITTSGCTVRGLGTQNATSISYDWIALGV